MAGVKVKLSGPLFAGVPQKMLDEETKQGIIELVDIGAGMVRERIGQVHGRGTFYNSIRGDVKRTRVGVIRSLDDRKLRTWLEAGTRRGKKLRKGTYMFQRARRTMNTIRKAGYFEGRIASRLNR